jgi:hypothetical protein
MPLSSRSILRRKPFGEIIQSPIFGGCRTRVSCFDRPADADTLLWSRNQSANCLCVSACTSSESSHWKMRAPNSRLKRSLWCSHAVLGPGQRNTHLKIGHPRRTPKINEPAIMATHETIMYKADITERPEEAAQAHIASCLWYPRREPDNRIRDLIGCQI